MTVKTIQNGCLLLVLSVLSTGLSGCGFGDQPELGQVTGTVTRSGLPLGGVEVVFYPDSGRPARGVTDAEGKYELTYIRDTKGTKVGHNRVEIGLSEEADSEEADEVTESEADIDGPTAEEPAEPGRLAIPARYNSKSELEADVQPGENVFDFALES